MGPTSNKHDHVRGYKTCSFPIRSGGWSHDPAWRAQIVFGVALSLAGSVLSLVQPLFVKAIVDVAIPRARTDLLAMLLAGLVITPVAVTALTGAQTYVLGGIGKRVAQTLRVRLFSNAIRLPMRTVKETKPGDMVSTITRDCGEMEAYLSNDLLSATAAVIQLIGLAGVLIYLDWDLALLGLGVSPMLMLAVRALRNRVRAVSDEQAEHRAHGASSQRLGSLREPSPSRTPRAGAACEMSRSRQPGAATRREIRLLWRALRSTPSVWPSVGNFSPKMEGGKVTSCSIRTGCPHVGVRRSRRSVEPVC